jgi:hypothetical protein
VDFGYAADTMLLGSISGQLWHDAQADGSYDPINEAGLAGVSVSLMRDTNGNRTWERGEPIAATTTSDRGGRFLFSGVPAGDYLVTVSDTHNILAGYGPTTVGATTQNRAQPHAVSLTPGAANLSANFGYVQVGQRGRLGVIGNQVWYDADADADGLFEPGEGEIGIAGVTVTLYREAALVATTTTAASGQYAFTGLTAGRYTVQVSDEFDILNNYTATVLGPQPGQDDNNQVQPYLVELPADGRVMSADFGYRPAPVAVAIWAQPGPGRLLPF